MANETKTLKTEQSEFSVTANEWEKENQHRVYFRIQGANRTLSGQCVWDVNKQEWLSCRDRMSKLEQALEKLFNLLPEPPTPEEPKAEPKKVASNWQYFPFDGYFQAQTADGKIVRCDSDNFADHAAECEEAGIDLTPERALEEEWVGFYAVDQEVEKEVRSWGGKREGAGRPKEPVEPVMQIARELPESILDQMEAKHGAPSRKTSAYFINGDGWGPELFLGNRRELDEAYPSDKRWQYASRSYAFVWYGEYNRELQRDIDILASAVNGEGRMREISRQRAIERGYKLPE